MPTDYKQLVIAGGGTYRGEMKDDVSKTHLVLFDGPYNKSTMALHAAELVEPDAVTRRINEQRMSYLSCIREKMS